MNIFGSSLALRIHRHSQFWIFLPLYCYLADQSWTNLIFLSVFSDKKENIAVITLWLWLQKSPDYEEVNNRFLGLYHTPNNLERCHRFNRTFRLIQNAGINCVLSFLGCDFFYLFEFFITLYYFGNLKDTLKVTN